MLWGIGSSGLAAGEKEKGSAQVEVAIQSNHKTASPGQKIDSFAVTSVSPGSWASRREIVSIALRLRV
jgi:hypothetical protein